MHLLGFEVGPIQRAIIYIPPNAPWKIRDHASAGFQRLRLSGLLSRAHLIHKYTYTPSAIERALAQLAELYVQKGHDLHLCQRALRKMSTWPYPLLVLSPTLPPLSFLSFLPSFQGAPNTAGCVCLSTPVSKVFHCFTFLSFVRHSAGGPSMCCERWSNEAATAHADIWPDQPDVPASHV